MNMEAIGKMVPGWVIIPAAGRGNKRAISKSNSKKSIATKKNRNENGTRADLRGSNPHS